MENENKQGILLPFISLTCAFFTFLFFIANLFYHFALNNSALDLVGTVFLLAIASMLGILVSICLFYGKKTGFINKIFPFFFSLILFTVSIFMVFIFYYILLSNNMTAQNLWNLQLMLYLLGFSVVEAIMLKVLKINNYLIKAIIQFVVIGIFYFILTLAIFKIGSGSALIFVIFAYLVVFAISSTAYYFIISQIKKAKNDEKKYKKQF